MKTRRIDAERWMSFFASFNGSHRGWAGTLEVRDPGRPPRIEVDVSPFQRANFESQNSFVLTFGEEPEEHFAYSIHEPRTLLSSEREDGTEASLIIEASDGSRAILTLVNTVRMEEIVAAR